MGPKLCQRSALTAVAVPYIFPGRERLQDVSVLPAAVGSYGKVFAEM